MKIMRRRRELKTDYGKRLKLLKGRKTRLVVKRNLDNIHVQFINYEKNGDKTVVEEISKNLVKYGWKYHCGNLPAAYLIGLAAGLKAKKLGIDEAILDTGMQMSIKGGAIYAAVAGVIDSGMKVPVGEAMPDKERISGKHIAEYAKSIGKEKYEKQFSGYIKKGAKPEDMSINFEDVKKNIIEQKMV
ncbi:MAG: 50S ribosomal protein L18 [Candidatus Aenigmatarchaeota archaeon]